MTITAYRGSHQIGGCVTEIKTAKSRILIDFGAQLPDREGAVPEESLEVPGVTTEGPDCDGIFFTHYHGDHAGGIERISQSVPLYMGQAGEEILRCLWKRTKKQPAPVAFRTFRPAQRISLHDGDLTVTPLAVDHSAYDAYMFLIEGDGRRVLHTGDFRSHGFRGKGLWKVLDKYVGKIDVLILEGTVLSRPAVPAMTENGLKWKLKEYFQEIPYSFVLCSSTNIDRIAAVQEAARAVRRPVYCDEYQREVLDIAHRHGAGRSRLYDFSSVRIWNGETRAPFVMLIRKNDYFRQILERFPREKSGVIYSMWDGYLEQEEFRRFLAGRSVRHLHTSGHADWDTLKMLCERVKPKVILPIHTEHPERMAELGVNGLLRMWKDKEPYIV